MQIKAAPERRVVAALAALAMLLSGFIAFAPSASAHFAGIDESTTLVCDGDLLILRTAAVSWAEDMTGEHPRVVIEMRTDVSDWETVVTGEFSEANGWRLSGSAVVAPGASFVDVRVTVDPDFTWGDGFSAPTPPAETRLVVGPGLTDCTSVILPPPTPEPTPPVEPTPTPEPPGPPTGIVPEAFVGCVGDTDDREAIVEITTESATDQDVSVLVDGEELTTVTVGADSPAIVDVPQDPGETNTVDVVHDGDTIASATIQCVDTIIIPPGTPTPTPSVPPNPPTPPGPELPATGSQSRDIASWAMVAIIGGALLVIGGISLRSQDS
jgi:LPXTG-motif cell wall-anchored protein